MAKNILILSSSPEVVQRLRDTLEPESYLVTVTPGDADIVEAVTQSAQATGHVPKVVILALDSVVAAAKANAWAYESRIMKRLKEPHQNGYWRDGHHPAVFTVTSRYIPPDFCGGDLFDMYLREPFRPQELLAFVRRVIDCSEE